MNKPLSIFGAAAFITAIVGAAVHLSSKRTSKNPRTNDSPNTTWLVEMSPRAKKELQKLTSSERRKVDDIITELQLNPYSRQGQIEKLVGKKDVYSKRVDIKNRVVFNVDKQSKTVTIFSVAGHYDRMNGDAFVDIRSKLTESNRLLTESIAKLETLKSDISRTEDTLQTSLQELSSIEAAIKPPI